MHQEINNNRYEAKTIYTPFFDNRGHCGVAGFNDCISSMQYAWHTNEFTAICYGYRIYHPKTKLLYHLCIIVARYIIEAIPSSHFALANEKTDTSSSVVLPPSAKDCVEVQKKRMELFHYEYQREHQQYQQRKEEEENKKLNAILRYTRETFKRFDLNETEIFQICESVRYFVTNHQVFSMTEVHIKKHSSLTQISLKNFAWNIAFQYNIGRDMTTSFVMATFAEWFANSTFDTVRKNLRTTTGPHKIEIDEKILSKYGI